MKRAYSIYLKTVICLFPFILSALLIVANSGCKKKDEKQKPTLTTVVVYDITENTATCGGTITSDGGAEITERGVCWSYGRNPTVDDSKTSDGTGEGSFSSSLTGLVPNSTYYVMAYATNSEGTMCGNIVSFKTLHGSGSVTDIDGNVYDTVLIGNQVWMVQNLRVTHYRNGDPVDSLGDNTEWCCYTTGGYCNFSNDINNVPVYGRLYNWYAVNDSRNIAPEGWHVATDAEWETLVNYLGGAQLAGGKLKEGGTTHWVTPNTGASNEVGFTALPSGTRFGQYGIPGYGTFSNLGKTTEWWAADEQCSWGVGFDIESIVHNTDSRRSDGFSIRCIRD